MTDSEFGELARQLRRNMTQEERILWNRLKRSQLGVAFRRQEPMRPFIVDFVCYEKKLIVELDGSQHADNPQDRARDAYFAQRGFRTLRFWNREVRENLEGVLERILDAIGETERVALPPSGGG
ncbi:endonuclease domain-containing protein [Meiothermus sp. CFH 77666]|uniref:endonuclease domain-containing protein n=1 Tax=Meiothermus sp. CFH 77666 TaxID=2817942 RepID=UPI001AA0925C|nr:endonuclease domain-containing protein [Meiothermus sp. CFH 77666]MBO1437752.1 endonuclease domain-containing protein [Meiothermus sp. CFH 77666]